MVNFKERSFENEIEHFKELRGDKTFHVIGGWTENPGTPHERHEPRKIVRGPLRSRKCRTCQEELKPIVQNDPKRRLLHYCSDRCRKEHEEIEKIRKKLNAEVILWPPQKPPIPKDQLTYTVKGGDGAQIKYKARKRWVNPTNKF